VVKIQRWHRAKIQKEIYSHIAANMLSKWKWKQENQMTQANALIAELDSKYKAKERALDSESEFRRAEEKMDRLRRDAR